MKMKNSFLYILMLLIAASFALTSCEDKEDPEPNPEENNEENQKVNKWIYEEMEEWYYWNDKIPTKENLNFNLDPEDFFENHILFDYQDKNGDGEGDRFSWMEPFTHTKTKSGEATSDLGFDYSPMWEDETMTAVVLIITYIKPNTIAEKEGLRRGFLISKVDGSKITSHNWFSVLHQNKGSYRLQYAENVIQFIEDDFKTLTLNVTPNYKENPVLMDTIYQNEDGHKIGYIVFNTFGSEQDEEHLKNDIYLIERLQRFESQGITDLVLDLRYNGGGLVQTATYLGSALVPSRNTKDIFQISKYNKAFQAKLENLPEGNKNKESWLYTRFVDNIFWEGEDIESSILNRIPNLGDKIQTLCIIGTGYTASSSEMVLNCLKPYMRKHSKNLYLVGERTVGKNVGSWSIEPEDKEIKWKLQPITFQTYNVDNESDYAQGFVPDVPAKDFEDLGEGLKAFGDKDETLLAAAIGKITGKKSSRVKSVYQHGLKPLPASEIEKRKGAYQMIVGKKDLQSLKKQLKSLSVE